PCYQLQWNKPGGLLPRQKSSTYQVSSTAHRAKCASFRVKHSTTLMGKHPGRRKPPKGAGRSLSGSRVALLVIRVYLGVAFWGCNENADFPPLPVTWGARRPIPDHILIAYFAAERGSEFRNLPQFSGRYGAASGDVSDLTQPPLSHELFE